MRGRLPTATEETSFISVNISCRRICFLAPASVSVSCIRCSIVPAPVVPLLPTILNAAGDPWLASLQYAHLQYTRRYHEQARDATAKFALSTWNRDRKKTINYPVLRMIFCSEYNSGKALSCDGQQSHACPKRMNTLNVCFESKRVRQNLPSLYSDSSDKQAISAFKSTSFSLPCP